MVEAIELERIERRVQLLEELVESWPLHQLEQLAEIGQHGNESHALTFLSTIAHLAIADSSPHHMPFGSPTIFVAASNATAAEKNAAGSTYTCPGTTDGAVFRAAIAALPATGGRIVASSGTFCVPYGDDIIVPSNFTVSGQGPATVFKIPDGQPAVGTIKVFTNAAANDHDIVLENFALDGNMANQPSGGSIPAHYGTYLSQCYRSTQRGLTAHGFTEHGLRFHGSGGDTSECAIHDCHSYDNRWTGIRLSSCGRVLCYGNTLRGNGLSGIRADGGINTLIYLNEIMDCDPHGIDCDNLIGGLIALNFVRGAQTNGIHIAGGSRNHISTNYLRENDVRGILVEGKASDPADHHAIVGNYITRHNDWGITVDGTIAAIDDLLVEHNYLWHNGNIAADTTIITVAAVNRLRILNNTVRKNAGDYGIIIATGAVDTVIKDNDLYDAGAVDGVSDAGTNTLIKDNLGFASPDDSVTAAEAVAAVEAEADLALKEVGVKLLTFDGEAGLTISGGKVTRTQTAHTVDSEDESPDDLTHVLGGVEGDFLFLRRSDTAPNITIKNQADYTEGFFALPGGVDIVLDSIFASVLFRMVYWSGYHFWVQVGYTFPDFNPRSHATRHKNGGADEVATATPTGDAIPKANAAGKLVSGWAGTANTLATLDAGTKVVENPANATATPTADKIPIADGTGKLASGWIPAHGSSTHTGKIGERQVRILIPLKQPLAVGTGRAVVDYEHKLLGSVTTRIRSWYVRAASNITGDTVFKLYRNGTAVTGAEITVSSGTRESAVDAFTEVTLADGDYLDVEEVSGSSENIAVDVYVLGDEDVMAAV